MNCSVMSVASCQLPATRSHAPRGNSRWPLRGREVHGLEQDVDAERPRIAFGAPAQWVGGAWERVNAARVQYNGRMSIVIGHSFPRSAWERRLAAPRPGGAWPSEQDVDAERPRIAFGAPAQWVGGAWERVK